VEVEDRELLDGDRSAELADVFALVGPDLGGIAHGAASREKPRIYRRVRNRPPADVGYRPEADIRTLRAAEVTNSSCRPGFAALDCVVRLAIFESNLGRCSRQDLQDQLLRPHQPLGELSPEVVDRA